MANTQDEKFTVIGHYRGNDYSDAVVDGVIKGEFDVYLPNADEETFAVLVEAIDADSAEQYVLEGRQEQSPFYEINIETRNPTAVSQIREALESANLHIDSTGKQHKVLIDFNLLNDEGVLAEILWSVALPESEEEDIKISEGIDDLVEQGRTARHNATQPSETPEVTE